MKSVAVMIGLLLLSQEVSAHEWYSSACCSERDCREAEPGEVQKTSTGWYVLPADEIILFGDSRIKPSMDINIHLCGTPDADHGDGGLSILCLYIPEPGT